MSWPNRLFVEFILDYCHVYPTKEETDLNIRSMELKHGGTKTEQDLYLKSFCLGLVTNGILFHSSIRFSNARMYILVLLIRCDTIEGENFGGTNDSG